MGIVCALVLNQHFKGRNFFRGVLLFPYLIPTIVVVILWKWLLNSSYGPVAYFLSYFDINIVWLSEKNILITLILVSIWQFFPFVLVTILARMQSIPVELYNAAKIDGAPSISQFIHITLPQIKNILLTIILLRTIWMFTKFDTPWLLAGKQGAGKYIQTLPIYAFRQTFDFLQAGMGAAISVTLLLILALSAMIYLWVFVTENRN